MTEVGAGILDVGFDVRDAGVPLRRRVLRIEPMSLVPAGNRFCRLITDSPRLTATTCVGLRVAVPRGFPAIVEQ